MPRRGLGKPDVMYSQQLPMMQGDLLGGPDDTGLGVDLPGAGGYTDQHGSHLLNRAINNRFMLSQTSKMYHHHHHHHHQLPPHQAPPHSLTHPPPPPMPHPPPRQRGRKPQNVHPSMAMGDQQSYVSVKQEPGVPHGMLMGDMFAHNTMNQLVMQNPPDMGIGQNMEVGGSVNQPSGSMETNPQGDVILVPSNLLKQGLMEGGEVVVGGGGVGGGGASGGLHGQPIGNEIEIGGHASRRGGGMVGGLGSSVAGTSSSEENDFDNLVIDTGNVRASGGYDCAECGAIMKSRGSLKKHIAKYHAATAEPEMDGESRIYACPACTYQTQRRDKLDKHIGKHLADGITVTGKKRPSKVSSFPQRMRHAAEEYRCALCPYKCTVEKALRKHHKLHQSGTKQFVVKVSCPICGKDRSTEADLRKHMKKHRDGKDFHCDICGFASIQLKKIIQHRRMHTGEKPHLCPHCTYRSSRRDNLRSHVRRMHKKENMYIDTFNPRMEPTVE